MLARAYGRKECGDGQTSRTEATKSSLFGGSAARVLRTTFEDQPAVYGRDVMALRCRYVLMIWRVLAKCSEICECNHSHACTDAEL